MTTPYTRMIDEQIVMDDESNLEEVRESCRSCDQAKELCAGASTWGIIYEGGQRGQMSRWPNGRGAINLGADSCWGDWGGDNDGLLTLDDEMGYRDECGEPCCKHGWPLAQCQDITSPCPSPESEVTA